MHLVFSFLIALLAVGILHYLWRSRPMPRLAGSPWGSGANEDPRIAAAAMMYAVASAQGRLSSHREDELTTLLGERLRLERDMAHRCFDAGKRLAGNLYDGDLVDRLHALMPPVAARCNDAEKQDVIDLLAAAAGTHAQRIGPVRDGIGRVSATLLHG